MARIIPRGNRPRDERNNRPSTHAPHSGGHGRRVRVLERTEVQVPQTTTKEADIVRIIPLGGVEEIGKNMTVIEFRDSIYIVDIGLQFTDEETPGVDYIVPDTKYLEARKKKIKGVFITHGHLDHIGGIPYIMDKLGNPPIYTRMLTGAMIKKRQEEFQHLARLNLEIVERDSRMKVAPDFSIRFFNVTHTIPDAMGVIFETPFGNLIFTGDLKIDHKDGVPLKHEEDTFGGLGKENNLALFADSTNVERPGFSLSEREVHKNLEEVIKSVKGRLFIASFASLLERIIFIIETAEHLGKKVVIDGRSLRNNVEIAKELGMLKVKPTTIITPEEADSHPPSKIILLVTGAQGDEFAALMRMANRTHKKIQLNKSDTVVLSSSIIPGNERAVQRLKDNLARQGPKIITYKELDVHSSGHAYREELLWILNQLKPRFFVPIHGYYHFLRIHADIAMEAGIPEDHVVIPDNGSIIEIYEQGTKIRKLKDKAVQGIVMIDALGTGDIKEVVVRDRQQLAQDGIFVIIATIDGVTGEVRKSPDIISRGFVYLKESQELLRGARQLAKKTIDDAVVDMHPLNIDYLKNTVREKVAKLLLQKTGKKPIVLPVLLEV